jgi:hypothetical protein
VRAWFVITQLSFGPSRNCLRPRAWSPQVPQALFGPSAGGWAFILYYREMLLGLQALRRSPERREGGAALQELRRAEP